MKTVFWVPMALFFCLCVSFPNQLDAADLVYQEDFDSALGSEWTLNGVGVVSLPTGGRTVVTNTTGSTNGGIAPSSPNGLRWGDLGDTFAPIKAASSFDAYGFGGSWLVNNSSIGGSGDFGVTRTASVAFSNLPNHTTLGQISLLLGAADSIDTNEGVFEIQVDGSTVFLRDFESGGSIRSSSAYTTPNTGPDPTPLATRANLSGTGFYRERWNDNGGSGPLSETDRYAESWTVDSAYSLDLFDLPHTERTLTLDFIWRGVNSYYTDEFIAMDNLLVVVPLPEPATLLIWSLLAGLGMSLGWRRRR